MAVKILVVDDDLDTLRLVGMMLEKQGHTIVAAGNGEQALALARQEQPSLVILDIMMPDMSGVEVARALRSDPATQNVLIMMFTAKTQLDDKLEGFDVGADDYLTKPVQPRELIAHVNALLKRPKRARVTAEKARRVRGQVVGILAAKGGLGVSTLATNLGLALLDLSKKDVVVADLRPGCGTIGLELGYEKSRGMSALLDLNPSEIDLMAVESELIAHKSGVRFLLSSPFPEDARHFHAVDVFAAVCQNLAYTAPWVVLDLGVSKTPVNEMALKQCNQVVIVVEPVAHTIYQSKELLAEMGKLNISPEKVLVVLINRYRFGIQLSLSQVQDLLGENVSVVFTAAPEQVYQAAASGTPLVLQQGDSITTQQFFHLAEKVIQNSL